MGFTTVHRGRRPTVFVPGTGQFLCLVQDNFLTQHVLEPTTAARVLDTELSPQTEFPACEYTDCSGLCHEAA